nr:hypothetical protein [Priestia megaterium]
MEIIWMLIVGGIIGWLAGLITGRNVPGGIIVPFRTHPLKNNCKDLIKWCP